MQKPDNKENIAEITVKNILKSFEEEGWHEISTKDLKSSLSAVSLDTKHDVSEILSIGKKFMTLLSQHYVQTICKNDSEERWLHSIAQDPFFNESSKKTTGTFADRMDSTAVLIQKNPVMNWILLSELIKLSKGKNIHMKISSIEVLYALFIELLPTRKLRYINQIEKERLNFIGTYISHVKQGGFISWDIWNSTARDVLLATVFEDYIKGIYSTYIQVLSDLMNDGEDFMQKKASNYCLQLLIQKPEQEDLLLELILSRVGNKNNKISANAVKLIDTLLENHRAMKSIIVNKVCKRIIQTLNRAHQQYLQITEKKKVSYYLSNEIIDMLKGVYFYILYISKLKYSRTEENIMQASYQCYLNLIPIFFSFPGSKFGLPLYEYDECSKIIRLISVSIERCLKCFENSGIDKKKLLNNYNEDNINSIFRAAHRPISLSTNISLLSLLSALFPSEGRTYNLLYERLLDMRMFEVSNTLPLLTLLYKMIGNDANITRITAFVKRLLQISLCLTNNNTSIVIAQICHQIISKFKGKLKDIIEGNLENDDYVHNKRDPSFTMADKSHLWELELCKVSYHPVFSTESSIMTKKLKNPVEFAQLSDSFKSFTLFQELSIFSGALQHEKFQYTLEKFWKHGKKPLPHQIPFKLYYHYKSQVVRTFEKAQYGESIGVEKGSDVSEGDGCESVESSDIDDDVTDEGDESSDIDIDDDVTDEGDESDLEYNSDIDSDVEDVKEETSKKRRISKEEEKEIMKKRRELGERLASTTRGNFADILPLGDFDEYL